jgi:hypothetical protein
MSILFVLIFVFPFLHKMLIVLLQLPYAYYYSLTLFHPSRPCSSALSTATVSGQLNRMWII